MSVSFFHVLRSYISLCSFSAFIVNTQCLSPTQWKCLSGNQYHTARATKAKRSKLFPRTSSYFMDTNIEPWKKDSQEETDKTGKNKQTTVVSNTLTGFGWNHFHQHFQELSGICYDIWPFVPWWLLGNKQLGVMKWKHLQSYTFRGFLIFWIS